MCRSATRARSEFLQVTLIRTLSLTPNLLNAWLVSQAVAKVHRRYQLRLWRESRAALAAVQRELQAYVDECFDDARRHLRAGFTNALSPFNTPVPDPAANFPGLLNQITLQGYFGEILAGLAVEHWGAHGHNDWKVPAFLFRLHPVEFQHLETINARIAAGEVYDPNDEKEKRPGRTGDDCLAFRINNQDAITDVLTLEAKCLGDHKIDKIKDAHAKVAAGGALPTGVRELINLLSEYNTPQAQRWQAALLKLWAGGYQVAVRRDGVSYACAQTPKKAGKISWMAHDAPHAAYTATRHLEGLEFHLDDLDALMAAVY